jgi:CO dehydrogenase maturation factor
MSLAPEPPHPLAGKRILVCGKGGSGKSTIVVLMAGLLQRRAYEVLVLDGDASNPEGLVRLLFGMGVEGEPRPLIDFFGGVDVVTCPVDDPSPLTRVGDRRPVPQHRIDISREIPPEYFLRRDGTLLLQAGKIEHYGQGCDGPIEKVVRDFMIDGEAVQLIDTKAGVEHFGRRIPDRMDVVLTVLDFTLESVSIARRVAGFCEDAGIRSLWFILNKVGAAELTAMLLDELGPLRERMIGFVPLDQGLLKMSLSGGALSDCAALEEVERIVAHLEENVASQA